MMGRGRIADDGHQCSQVATVVSLLLPLFLVLTNKRPMLLSFFAAKCLRHHWNCHFGGVGSLSRNRELPSRELVESTCTITCQSGLSTGTVQLKLCKVVHWHYLAKWDNQFNDTLRQWHCQVSASLSAFSSIIAHYIFAQMLSMPHFNDTGQNNQRSSHTKLNAL